MANANKIASQKIDWTGSTGAASTTYLDGTGVFSSPTGTSPSFSNVVYVAMNGVDATALTQFTAAGNKGVLAYPFLTIQAAISAVASLSPAGTFANPRGLVKVLPGYYIGQVTLSNCVDIELMDATVDLQTNAATYTVTDNGVSLSSAIYGNGAILRSDGAAGLGCINQSGATSNIKIYCAGVSATFGNAVTCTAGRQTVFCHAIGAAAGIAVSAIAGFQHVVCMTGESNGTTNFSYITGATNSIKNTGALQYIDANFVSLLNGGATPVINCTGGTTITRIESINGNNAAGTVLCSGGSLVINNSRVVASATFDTLTQTGGTLIIRNCTLFASSTGVTIANSSTVQLQGHNDANAAIGTSVTLTGSGSLSISSTNT